MFSKPTPAAMTKTTKEAKSALTDEKPKGFPTLLNAKTKITARKTKETKAVEKALPRRKYLGTRRKFRTALRTTMTEATAAETKGAPEALTTTARR